MDKKDCSRNLLGRCKVDKESRDLVKDYLSICLLILYLFTSCVGVFIPKVKELQPVIKENIELLKVVP